MKLWSEDIGELCGSLKVLCVVSELHFKEQLREQGEPISKDAILDVNGLLRVSSRSGAMEVIVELVEDEDSDCWIYK